MFQRRRKVLSDITINQTKISKDEIILQNLIFPILTAWVLASLQMTFSFEIYELPQIKIMQSNEEEV